MSELAPESFDTLLREKIAELDAEDAPPVFVEDDPVERLGLDARQTIQADVHGPIARGGKRGYRVPAQPAATEGGPKHLNIVY